MNKRGRPRFEPTDEQCKNVEIMVGLGIRQEDICLVEASVLAKAQVTEVTG
jgi:hypothetical protein